MAQIKVTVVEGKNFRKKDLNSDNDPYVEIYLDNSDYKQQTTVKYNSANPKWNEVLVLNHQKGQDLLHVNVYDQDYIGIHKIKSDKIGSVTIDLKELYEKQRIDNWYTILSHFRKSASGELHLILEYKRSEVE